MFKPTFRKLFEVEGQSVDVAFKRMSRAHAMKAAPIIDSDGKKVGTEKSLEFMDISAEILKDCILSISGLKKETDKGVEEYVVGSQDFNDEVLNGSYFTGFVSEMIAELVQESFAKEDEVKK